MGLFDALFETGLFRVQRSTVTGKDPLGKPISTIVTSAPINGILRQTGSVEGEAFVVNEFAATFPLGTDVRAGDKVIARGVVYTVEGTPFASIIPKTTIGVVQARLKYVGPVT